MHNSRHLYGASGAPVLAVAIKPALHHALRRGMILEIHDSVFRFVFYSASGKMRVLFLRSWYVVELMFAKKLL